MDGIQWQMALKINEKNNTIKKHNDGKYRINVKIKCKRFSKMQNELFAYLHPSLDGYNSRTYQTTVFWVASIGSNIMGGVYKNEIMKYSRPFDDISKEM